MSAYAYPLLIKAILETPLARRAQGEIVYRQSRQDYRQLRARVGRLAGALTVLGVRPGDVVAVMDWDSNRYLEAFFAVPMMGAVLLTVNVRLAPEQIAYCLNHAGAKLVLVHGDFLGCLAAIAPKLASVERFVELTDGDRAGAAPIAFAGEYEALLAAAGDVVFGDFDENSRATMFYTTGTTGDPKAVCFSHRQIVLHTLAVLTTFGMQAGQGRFDRSDVYMPMTPMFHVHAWGFPYAATMAGVKQIYPGRYVPGELLVLRRREGVTFSHCVPTILQMLLAAAGDQDLTGWKLVIGGAALPSALAEAARARGMDVFAGYGMSETCPILTVAHEAGDVAERVAAGLPAPLVSLRIVDEAMNDVAEGEVVVRAPWLTQSYAGNDEAGARLWAGGWLHTGDIGRLSEDGRLRITDRIKDVIKSGGEWISSGQLEDLLLQHPAVAEAAVLGMPDAQWSERPLALIVRKRDCDTGAIIAHMQGFADRGLICRLAVPTRVEFVESLARTSVGKLDKKAMRARFLSS